MQSLSRTVLERAGKKANFGTGKICLFAQRKPKIKRTWGKSGCVIAIKVLKYNCGNSLHKILNI